MKVARIKKHGETWDFLSESDLEDFIWENLIDILDVKPLLRQHFIDHQNRCDILALDHNGGLYVIELKKGADDGVIPQLTRYYASITKNPLTINEVDRSKPISLIAISNAFHKNSLIEVQYSRLEFQLLRYSIQEKNGALLFRLHNYFNDLKVAEFSIEAAQEKRQELLLPSSKLFLRLLQSCDSLEIDSILEARQKILLFSQKIQEVNKQGYVVWSYGEKVPVAEFRLDNERGKAFFYLYLPFQKMTGRRITSRIKAKVWLLGEKVTDVGFIFHPRMNPITHAEWLKGKSFCREKEAVRYWKKYALINEEDLKKMSVRKSLLEKHTWFGAEYGLALPISKYEELLRIHNVVDASAACQNLASLVDIALIELSRKNKR